jgi:hypothetical protein
MTGITNKGISDLFSTSLTLGLKRYEDVVKEKPTSENRLYKLSTKNGLILSQTPQSQDDKKDPKNFFQKVGNFLQNFSINSPGSGVLMKYSGGPGSILGVGQTIIPFADRRTGKTIEKLKDEGFFTKGYSIFKRQNTVTLSNPIQNTSQANINYINTVPSGSAKGASSTYEFLTRNPVGNNIEYTSPLAPSGQRTNTNDFSVYQPGTLTPGPLATDFKNYQTLKIHTINYTGSVPSSSIKGASSTYESLTKEPVNNNIIPGNQRINTDDFSVYEPGTFKPSNLSKTQTGPFKGPSIYTYDQSQLIDASNNKTKQAFKEDFRKPLIPSQSTFNPILSISPSYIDSNYAKRTNAGDPGFSNTIDGEKNVLNYTQASGISIPEDYKIALDKITAGAIYSATTALHNPDNGEYAGNDLVKFSIGVVQNNTTGLSNFMHFRAFIDSFSDSYNADWGSYNYVGRGDKFYNYEGFERTINLSFTVFAQSKAELIPMYKKLNYLASSLAPDYSEKSGFMKGNLHKLTIGGYLFDQVGIIKSITYDIPEETPWEIGINNQPEAGYDTSVKELPHMIKVTNLSFIPIQHFLPRVAKPLTKDDKQSKTRYIALATNTSDDDTNYTKVRT